MVSSEYIKNTTSEYHPASLGENFQPNFVLYEKRPFREKLVSFVKESSKVTGEALLQGILLGGVAWLALEGLTDFLPNSLPHSLKEVTSPQIIGGVSAAIGVFKSAAYLSDKLAKQWYGVNTKA